MVLPEGPECGETIAPNEIALSGDGSVLLAGAPDCEIAGRHVDGRLYAYARSGTTWSLTQTFNSPETLEGNEFAQSLAISGDGSTAAVTVGYRVSGLPAGAGASWIFQREGGVWHLVARLTAPTPQPEVYFSCPAISQDGSRLICRAGEAVGSNSRQGVIYAFDRPAGGWGAPSTPTRLFALEGSAGDYLSPERSHSNGRRSRPRPTGPKSTRRSSRKTSPTGHIPTTGSATNSVLPGPSPRPRKR